MQTTEHQDDNSYAKCIDVSKRVRWEIERDVIKGRTFDFREKFLPDGLTLVKELEFLTPTEQHFLSQVQGRTYANIFGLVERFIAAKMVDVSRDHWLGDQTAMEAMVRFTDEELKHQQLFRRIESMMASGMPEGYRFDIDPNAVATFVLGKSTWAVLGLTCHIELFVLSHYRASIDHDESLSELFKDVFKFHWKEESQHAILDELEWMREDAKLATDAARDAAVEDLIALVQGVDGILQAQAKADAAFFLDVTGMTDDEERTGRVRHGMLKAYRWQYIMSGATQPRFQAVLRKLVSGPQLEHIQAALAPLAYAMPAEGVATQ